MRVHYASRPLANEEASAPFDDECDETAWRRSSAPAEIRKLLLSPVTKCGAEFFDRAKRASR